jgi:integrase
MQSALRGFLRFCQLQGYVESDLSIAVPAYRRERLSSVPKAIDEDTTRRLLEIIDGDLPIDLRDRAIILILVTYAVRGVQVRRLRLDDIDWERDRIFFRAAKGGKDVVQHLTPEVGNSLIAYIRDGRHNQASFSEVFLTARHPFKPLKYPSTLSGLVSQRLRRIGAQLPEGVSHGAHCFRHAFATRLVGKVPLKHIADMLGHRNISSTLIYTKVDFAALQQAALPWPVEQDQ